MLKEERVHGQDTERSAGVHARQDGLGGHGVSRWRAQRYPEGVGLGQMTSIWSSPIFFPERPGKTF
jgi:hypothetical protein